MQGLRAERNLTMRCMVAVVRILKQLPLFSCLFSRFLPFFFPVSGPRSHQFLIDLIIFHLVIYCLGVEGIVKEERDKRTRQVATFRHVTRSIRDFPPWPTATTCSEAEVSVKVQIVSVYSSPSSLNHHDVPMGNCGSIDCPTSGYCVTFVDPFNPGICATCPLALNALTCSSATVATLW